MRRRLLAFVALATAMLSLFGCATPEHEPVDETVWLAWQSTSLTLENGAADLFYVQLAAEQKIAMYFSISPSNQEIAVVVGTIRNPSSANWSWGYQEEEYPRVGNDDVVVFEATHSYDYGIWMKPRLDETVHVSIKYRFST